MPKTIAFSMLQESGHLNPTFKIARTLRRRGHRVMYFAAQDLESQIASQGFETIPWFPDLYPQGITAIEDALSGVKKRRAITSRFLAMATCLSNNEGPVAALRPANPDLVVVDVTLPLMAFAARRQGWSLLNLHTSLPQTKDPGIPPLRSEMAYDASLRGRIRTELAWRQFLAKRRVSARLVSAAGMCPPYALTRRLAAEFGVHATELDTATVYMPQLKGVPELVLCPPDFDFPRPNKTERQHGESVDLERHESDFAWERLDGRSLVYASLGSQLYATRHARPFFNRLIDAFRERPDWQLVLSLGRHLDAAALGVPPENVILARTVPQLAILQRARLMITHGGLGSIKECVLHGVPMIVFPLDVDQPGNAARVRHHGLGLSGDVARVTPAGLLGMLDSVMANESFAENARRMKARFERVERAEGGADFVERCAG